MRGNLSTPPIIISRSTRKMTIQTIIALLVAVFASYSIATDGPKAWNIIVALASTIGAASFAYQLVRPDMIRIDANGVYWKSIRKAWHRRWPEISHFELVRIRFSTFCGIVLSTERPTAFERLAEGMTGVHGMFDGGWEISAAELLALLSDAKDFWGKHNVGNANLQDVK